MNLNFNGCLKEITNSIKKIDNNNISAPFSVENITQIIKSY